MYGADKSEHIETIRLSRLLLQE